MIYLFDCSGYDTVDDLFLQYYIQNQDRDDAEQKTCHDGSVICGVGSVKAVGGKRQSQQLFVGQYQGRQQEVIPDPHRLQDSYGNVCRLHDRKYNGEKGSKWCTSVDHCCFFNFQWNGFYKSAEHEYCKTCTKSEVNDDDSPRCTKTGTVSHQR